MTQPQTNLLYYGDNNVIFRDESGNATDAQLLAFEDTWHWGPSAESAHPTRTSGASGESTGCRTIAVRSEEGEG